MSNLVLKNLFYFLVIQAVSSLLGCILHHGFDPFNGIPDEASNGALGVNTINLFCCKQNVLDLIMELFFMLVTYCLYYMTVLIEKYDLNFKIIL